jgi:hypothetical protein
MNQVEVESNAQEELSVSFEVRLVVIAQTVGLCVTILCSLVGG